MRALLAIFLLALPAPLLHAQSYPVKPVRIIITNAPGVANDTIARGIAQFLGPKTGQPFVIDNRVGGEGVIGLEGCANAAPDGYTYCISAQGAIVLNALLRPKEASHVCI